MKRMGSEGVTAVERNPTVFASGKDGHVPQNAD
jgi:hypothetical protein